jgi:kynurenine formamidase
VEAIDLTAEISQQIRVFPGSPSPSFIQWSKFDTHGYDSEVVFMSTHTGTHMDAPSHFVKGGQSIDRIPASRFVCNALLLEIPKSAGQVIEPYDIPDADIVENDTIVFLTGWERRHAESDYMTSNPGLSKEAAVLLGKKRINAVGIDGPSIDAGSDQSFSAHHILLGNGILIIENLRHLGVLAGKLPATRRERRGGASMAPMRFTLIVAPLKLAGASGSPVRAIGLIS